MAAHVIFVHGRGRKPWIDTARPDFTDPDQIDAAAEGLRRIWLRALLVGLQRHASPRTHRYWRRHRNRRVHLAYYGDLFNVINGGADGLLHELERPLDALIERTAAERPDVRGFLRDEAITLAALIAQGLGFKDDALLRRLDDLRHYVGHHATGSAVRERLHEHLDVLLSRGDRVAIVSHSLGTLVAYDVLWKISHRSEFADIRDRPVDLLVTMGSPLGNSAFLNAFRIDAGYERKSQFPRNIRRWRNLTARGDYVAHDARLKNDLRRRRFLGYLEDRDLQDHVRLHNPYLNRADRWNPHKSLAYLLQPTLAQALDAFTAEAVS